MATVNVFVSENSTVRDKKIISGGIKIENTGDTPLEITTVTLSDGITDVQALTQEEEKTAKKGLGGLTRLMAPGVNDLLKSMVSYNVVGQVIPAKQKGMFTASFLVDKKLPKSFVLRIGGVGEVHFKK